MKQDTVSDIASAYKTTNITGKRVTDDISKVKRSTDYLDYVISDGILGTSDNYYRVCRILHNN